LALLTDLYELTMAQVYFQNRKSGGATFSLFIRSYPPNRGYFVAAGLEEVLKGLERFSFTDDDIDYLRGTKLFAPDFLDFLKDLRFTGEAWAVPEGRIFFKDEPILEITAPLIEAQIVETFVINQINLQTLIATKAARCLHAADGRGVVDFSLRRAQGVDAGLKVARASYLAGFEGTSDVLAGKRYGIPIVGTMAHSFILSFEREIDAFRRFADSFPNSSTFLIDTFDTVAGARKAVEVGREMARRGKRLRAVRLDSGDLAALSRQVRRILDDAGFDDVAIVASGGLDEYELDDLSKTNAPINSYGVGTKMGVSGDAPWFDMAYKLVEHEDRPVLKLSTGKATLPGKKQVFRFLDERRRLVKDVIGIRGDSVAGAEPLLDKVMENGKIGRGLPTLTAIRSRFLEEFGRLDDRYKAIRNPATYPVELSPKLAALKTETEKHVAETELSFISSKRGLGES
jgi:nicotinate phosphoribosyltransferase